MEDTRKGAAKILEEVLRGVNVMYLPRLTASRYMKSKVNQVNGDLVSRGSHTRSRLRPLTQQSHRRPRNHDIFFTPVVT